MHQMARRPSAYVKCWGFAPSQSPPPGAVSICAARDDAAASKKSGLG